MQILQAFGLLLAQNLLLLEFLYVAYLSDTFTNIITSYESYSRVKEGMSRKWLVSDLGIKSVL